ncbi:hypothetical protein ABK040_014832 [Willaertia magna]
MNALKFSSIFESIKNRFDEKDKTNDIWFNINYTIITISKNNKYVAISHLNKCYIIHISPINNLPKYLITLDKNTLLNSEENNNFTNKEKLNKINEEENNFLLVGTSEGFFRIFNADRGDLLFQERFYEAPILKLKFQFNFHYSKLESHHQENILLIYCNLILIIDTYSLRKRNFTNFIQKWFLKGKQKINDACLLYSFNIQHSPFNLFKERTCNYDIICSGSNPCIVQYTKDGNELETENQHATTTTVISSAITSSIYSWFMKGSSLMATNNNSKLNNNLLKKEKEERNEENTFYFYNQIIDHKREIHCIEIDYSGRYAITSDSLGRIMILDLTNLVFIKIFKGYREAQCQWLSIEKKCNNNTITNDNETITDNNTIIIDKNSEIDDNEIKDNRLECFVIYAPRRGLLEVWNSEKRLFAKTVGKEKRLLKSNNFYGNIYLMSKNGILESIKLSL